jgi:hypothetical protein
MEAEHLQELREAKRVLENPSMAARLTGLLGKPIEAGMRMLPDKAQEKINKAVQLSLSKSLDFLIKSFSGRKGLTKAKARSMEHKLAVMTSGATGGFFGLWGLSVELPVSTMIMLRTIMDIARSEGEDIALPESRLACLEVFALGGNAHADDAAETGYYAVRLALASSLAEAAKFIAQRGIAEEGAPVLVRLMAQISSRFGIVVSEKVAAQAVPIIGAVSGAAINTIFIDHFQKMAKGHFTVRRLEKIYGKENVQKAYEELSLNDTQF